MYISFTFLFPFLLYVPLRKKEPSSHRSQPKMAYKTRHKPVKQGWMRHTFQILLYHFLFITLCGRSCIYGLFIYMHVCAPCTCRACRGLQRPVDPLGLKLLRVVSHFVGTRNWTRIFLKRIQCF